MTQYENKHQSRDMAMYKKNMNTKIKENKMTILQYVSSNNIQEFCCKTTTELILVHTHKSRAGKEAKISELFCRENFCRLYDWNKYKSFDSFADKEIVKIEKYFTGAPIFYVNFTDFDWRKEIEDIFKDDKRNYNYYIDLERPRIR